ncbi:hypothetical protein [Micrococcus cohnii]|uniref:Uncharacterized protein n=1 Tax=Micrococcus cohnii TaxID=993416 RepID=A0A7W7GN17_9MICC|nr:hypothetical protein [Micrococcus cohnii]MBB4735112.1 hypothetical protein [Micrococcus cohnii]
MLNSLVLASAEGHHIVNELPVPTWVFGAVTFVILMALLFVTMSFRSVGLRHSEPTGEVAHHGQGRRDDAGHGPSTRAH